MDMNVVDQCQEAIRVDQGPGFKLHDSFGCAAGLPFNDNETTLWGTPFMYIVEDLYYAGGISSWVLPSKTAQVNNTEIYVDIVKVKSWINRIMKAKGFGTASYTHSTDEK